MLDWTRADLAAAAADVVTVRQPDAEGGTLRSATFPVVQQVFEPQGVELIPENGGGAGIRFQAWNEGTRGGL